MKPINCCNCFQLNNQPEQTDLQTCAYPLTNGALVSLKSKSKVKNIHFNSVYTSFFFFDNNRMLHDQNYVEFILMREKTFSTHTFVHMCTIVKLP